MIKFSDMSENAFRLAQCAKGKLPNGICNSIMDLIEDTHNAGDNIEAVVNAKYNFKNAIDGIDLKDCGFSADLYNSLIGMDRIIIDSKNIYAYMVYIIRLAKLINSIADMQNDNQPIIGRFPFDSTLSNTVSAYDIISDIEEKICYDSRIAQIYYVINNYDALLQYEYRSNEDYCIIWNDYKVFLLYILDTVGKSKTFNTLSLSKIEDNIIDLKDRYSWSKSYKRIDTLKNIVNICIIKMVKNICAARKDANSHGNSVGIATVMGYINDAINAIDSNITLSEMNECSCLNYYISDYISKIDNADDIELEHCSEKYRSEFISKIQCIAEDNGYSLSEFDTACLNAIMVFGTYTDSCGNCNCYNDAISELRKLLKANSIDDVNKVTEAIRNLIPSGMVNKSINIGAESKAKETEESTTNEKPDKKNKSTDDPSECSEWIEELSAAVSKMKDITSNMLPKNSMEEDSCKEAIERINQINNICDSISNKANEFTAREKDAPIRLGYLHEVDDKVTVEQNLSVTHLSKEDKEKWNESVNSKPISWNEYFMELAETAAKRSKDPNSKVGACIMDPRDHRVVSLGYNGFPYGCSDDEFPWSREGDDNKYLYVVHAELNAILSARKDLTGCVLFVTYSPCNECMKAIIQSGIKAVVYKNEYKPGNHTNIASTKMAKSAGVSVIKYDDLLGIEGNFFDLMHNSLLKNFEHETE